ncbi:MAG: ATP-dependent RecD-like DNA helicase [Clostridia bacterium]|nr:ATP-dependent RecD-like DNA helicase [Clostridia bacterium]
MIKGEILNVIYHNAENGFTILLLNTKDGEITATGKFPLLGIGEVVELEGEFKFNSKYGEQFVASSIKIEKPTSLIAMINYLSSGLISGVGTITASNIVNTFKEQTFDVIENQPEKLASIRGISIKKAGDIALAYKDIKKMQESVMFLQQYDISINMAVKIYNKYKARTQEVLNQNPYQLIEDIDGIGFKTADTIAGKLGISKDSEFRLRAGLVYTLSQIAELKGSTIAKKQELVSATLSLLDLPQSEEELDSVLVNLQISGLIKKVDFEDEDAFIMTKFYSMENYIAQKLKLLSNEQADLHLDFDREISDFELSSNIKLHENQIEAIKAGVSNGVAIITGGPGTGKTTIVKAILRMFKNVNLKAILMAPTGRASKRLEEQTGEAASTIHRALEMQGKGDGMFARNEHNPLDCDAIIVDEVSMIDDFVAFNLLKAINRGTRLILVGDKDQLPSVGAGNVLADLIGSGIFTTVYLTQIFRQSETSQIITNAHKINIGEMPNLQEKSNDFFYSSTCEPEEVKDEIVELVTTRIPRFLGVSPNDVQVIAPMKAGVSGVDNLNIALQEAINPKGLNQAQIVHGKRTFRVGDKVMQIKNNYDQEWVKFEHGIIVRGLGVFNGDIGFIEEINEQSQSMIVVFEDGRRANFTIVDLDNLTHAYAITIHKSQGSEFSVVIIPILGGNPMLFNRNLLYTAVTRAKNMVVLIGKQNNIYKMIKNEYIQKRYTLLKTFLQTQDNLFI